MIRTLYRRFCRWLDRALEFKTDCAACNALRDKHDDRTRECSDCRDGRWW